MEAIQAIGGSSFLLVSTVLAVRLLMLARKNRAIPELLLGLAFLFGGSLGALMEAGAPMAQEAGVEGMGRVFACGKVFGLIGISCNCAFTWFVFRRQSRWAVGLIVFLVALQVCAFMGHLSAGTFVSGVSRPLWFWLELVARIASPAWLGLEAFAYYRQMRRRAAIGLADAIVANRFLLWAIASATGMLFLLTSVPPLYLEANTPLVILDLAAFAFFGLATAFIYWLAFFPPNGYRRRIEGSVVA